MTDFLDPSQFADDDELFTFIIERLVKPRLRETLGTDDADLDDIQGAVYVFGGRGDVDQNVILHLQEHLQEGMDIDYVLSEMTDLEVRTAKEARYGGLDVRYVELGHSDNGGVRTLSAEDLEAMFKRS